MPKRIGKFKLGRTLGRGKFSRVKLCQDVQSGEMYAIKILSKKFIIEEEMVESVQKELAVLKIVQKLGSENCVQFVDVMNSKDNIYIIMELCNGGELFEKIVLEKKLDESTARYYFKQILSAICELHNVGIVHRDLKPENILLTGKEPAFIVKLMDFGFSTLGNTCKGSHLKLLKTTCGTPNYVAPEILKDIEYDGFKADIWSLGVILFVMCAGYLPFEANSINSLFELMKNESFKCPDYFSEPLKKLILSILKQDPLKRCSLRDIRNSEWLKLHDSKFSLKRPFKNSNY